MVEFCVYVFDGSSLFSPVTIDFPLASHSYLPLCPLLCILFYSFSLPFHSLSLPHSSYSHPLYQLTFPCTPTWSTCLHLAPCLLPYLHNPYFLLQPSCLTSSLLYTVHLFDLRILIFDIIAHLLVTLLTRPFIRGITKHATIKPIMIGSVCLIFFCLWYQ